MRLKPSKNTITLLGGGLVLMVFAFGGIVWLQQSSLAESGRDLTKKEAALADGQRIAKRQQLAQQSLEQDRKQLQFLESGVSDAAFVPTLLKQLEELAASTHNKVLGVRPQVAVQAPTRLQQRRDPDAAGKEGEKKEKVEKPDPYTRLNIEVNLIGTFQSSQEFVQRLTRFPKIVSVVDLQLQPHRSTNNGEQVASNALDVKVNLTAFVMKETVHTSPDVKTASAAVGGIN